MPQEKHPEVKITQDLLDEYASARSEWVRLMSVLEKLDPPLGV